MAGLENDDAALARFRPGQGRRVGPPGPPPVPGGATPQAETVRPAAPSTSSAQTAQGVPPAPGPFSAGPLSPGPFSAAPLSTGPIAAGTAPGWAGDRDPAPQPLFGDLVGHEPAVEQPLFEGPDDAWLPVDDDPGRATGIASIVVGILVGIVGLFLGVYSVRRSREAGLAGGLGIAGIVVSMLSIVVVGAIGLSWVRYEVQVAEQCSLVGPGVYVTSSGAQVTCR